MTIEYLRQFRVGGYAIFDLVVSFLGIYLLSPLLTKLFLKLKIRISKLSWMYLTLPMSIVVHLAVGNMTQMTRDFLDLSGHYWIKLIILGLTTLALREILKPVVRPKLNKSV